LLSCLIVTTFLAAGILARPVPLRPLNQGLDHSCKN